MYSLLYVTPLLARYFFPFVEIEPWSLSLQASCVPLVGSKGKGRLSFVLIGVFSPDTDSGRTNPFNERGGFFSTP